MAGFIHVYCGDGKGKTTAAVGLGVRAAGRGKQVFFLQFLKGEDSGERRILLKVPGFTVPKLPQQVKFTFQMSPEEKRQEQLRYVEYLKMIQKALIQFDVVILDEVFGAISTGMITEQEIVKLLQEKPEQTEVVLTGRNPGEEILSISDYVSEIKKIKHPFDKGIPAREGIEF
mgnify:CR=1 FL=1